MKRLNIRKFALKGIQRPTSMSLALASLTTVLIGLSAPAYSNGRIYWVSTNDTARVGVRSGRGANGQASGIVLRDRTQALAIAPGGYSAHVAVPGQYVRATSQGSETALYRYPCRFQGKGIYTIGYSRASSRLASDSNCTFTAPPRRAQQPASTSIHANFLPFPWSTVSLPFSWLTASASKSLHPTKFMLAQAGQRSACFQTPTGQVCVPCRATPSGTVCPMPEGAYQYLPDAKPTQDDDANAPSITVTPAPNTNDEILYQARFEDDRVVFHVISGTVVVTPPTGQPVSVPEGNKFVSSAGGGTVTPGIAADGNEVNEFLRPDLWSSVAPELQQFNQNLGFRIVELSVSTDKSNYVGPCPVAVNYTYQISVVGRSQVPYRLREYFPDGGDNGFFSGTFDFSDRSTQGTFGAVSRGQPGQRVSGSFALQTLSPQALTSEKAFYNIQCTP